MIQWNFLENLWATPWDNFVTTWDIFFILKRVLWETINLTSISALTCLEPHLQAYWIVSSELASLLSLIGVLINRMSFFHLLFFIFSFEFCYSILLPRGVGEDLLSPPLGRIRIGSFFFRCQVTKKGRMFCQFKIKPYLCNMLGVPHESHALETGSRGIKRESGESPELSP